MYKYLRSVSTGILIQRKVKAGKIDYRKHVVHLKNFMEGLKPKNIAAWHKELAAWERDHSNPDPYYVAPSGMYLAAKLCKYS